MLFLTTSFQVERIKKIQGKDFYSSGSETLSSLILRADKFSKIRIDDIYADRIFLVQTLNPAENKLNIEAPGFFVTKANASSTVLISR